MSDVLKGEAFRAWATPILEGRLGEDEKVQRYNSQLRDFILAERDREGHKRVGTVDAAKTGADLLRAADPVIEPLQELILDVAERMNAWSGVNDTLAGKAPEMVAEAWAVVYDAWGYHKLHAHHDSAWSGVYYVHTGTMAPGSGLIELLDPRAAAAAAEPLRRPLQAITPIPGLVIAFPSWLQHWVTPYDGDEERVCVAFNVGFAR